MAEITIELLVVVSICGLESASERLEERRTVALACAPLSARAVMVTSPAFFAVNTPSSSTANRLELELS